MFSVAFKEEWVISAWTGVLMTALFLVSTIHIALCTLYSKLHPVVTTCLTYS